MTSLDTTPTREGPRIEDFQSRNILLKARLSSSSQNWRCTVTIYGCLRNISEPRLVCVFVYPTFVFRPRHLAPIMHLSSCMPIAQLPAALHSCKQLRRLTSWRLRVICMKKNHGIRGKSHLDPTLLSSSTLLGQKKPTSIQHTSVGKNHLRCRTSCDLLRPLLRTCRLHLPLVACLCSSGFAILLT
jgi:hypothetical protein